MSLNVQMTGKYGCMVVSLQMFFKHWCLFGVYFSGNLLGLFWIPFLTSFLLHLRSQEDACEQSSQSHKDTESPELDKCLSFEPGIV